jgi:3-oxoacyl-[acyl-carrier protein] reductase
LYNEIRANLFSTRYSFPGSRTMALRKVAQPGDVANQVVVLASSVLSGHVTGQVVTVAGGMEGRVLR